MENEEYDSIVSKDLPKNLIDFAEDKLRIINLAYGKVKRKIKEIYELL